MVSADGGQPGTNTSTLTKLCTGRALAQSKGTLDGCRGAAPSLTRSRIALTPIGLRIDGTLAVTAQSPREISVLFWLALFVFLPNPPRC